MKKKRIKAALVILFLILLAVCIYFRIYYTRAHVRDAVLDYGEPKLYTLEDVKAAGDVVIEDFKTCGGFKGCKMLWIYYDEEDSQGRSGEEGKEIISFWVNYKTGLFPPFPYDDFSLSEDDSGWWLERKGPGDSWEIVGAGMP